MEPWEQSEENARLEAEQLRERCKPAGDLAEPLLAVQLVSVSHEPETLSPELLARIHRVGESFRETYEAAERQASAVVEQALLVWEQDECDDEQRSPDSTPHKGEDETPDDR